MNTRLFPIVALCCSGLLLAQDSTKPSAEEMHRLHQNSKAYIAFLEDPEAG